jgi:DNA-3-methyladenine glycosylase
MRQRRGTDDARALCSGPGKLCQALGITREHDGLALDRPPFKLSARKTIPEIATGPRIGLTRATELSWRYLEVDSKYVSRRG